MTMTPMDHKKHFLGQWIKEYCDQNSITLSEAAAITRKLVEDEAEKAALTHPEKIAKLQDMINVEKKHNKRAAVERGCYVFAVKKWRELTGCGLREAVDFVQVSEANRSLKL